MPSTLLRARDWREILQICQECQELGDSAVAWRTHLAERLGALCGAALVCSGEFSLNVPGMIELRGGVESGWEKGLNREAFLRTFATYTNMAVSPLLKLYADHEVSADGKCYNRKELITDPDWYRSSYFELIGAPIGVDHSMIYFNSQPNGQGICNAMTLSRDITEKQDFSRRHQALIEEVQLALTPLIGKKLSEFTSPSPDQLTRRVRQVLRCMLEGDTDKQIAARLQISVYTVNQYVKVIFHHFGVEGRTDLLSRWIRRGWTIGDW